MYFQKMVRQTLPNHTFALTISDTAIILWAGACCFLTIVLRHCCRSAKAGKFGAFPRLLTCGCARPFRCVFLFCIRRQ